MKKILIADDEDIVRRALTRMLRSDKYHITEAIDGEDAVSKWNQLDPDLVILDILMPKKTGIQVLEEVNRNENCKIILISAYSGGYNLEKAQELGAEHFIPKPFDDIHQIKSTIKEILGE